MAKASTKRLGCTFAIVGLLTCTPLASIVAQASDDAQLCDNSTNDPDEGIPACTRILTGPQVQKPESILNNRGNAWFRKGVYANAIADYGQAIQLNPKLVEAFRNRAFVLINQNEFDRAVNDLNQAITLDPKAPFALYLRGFALLNKGEFERSIRDFDAAIALKADYYAAYLHRGDAWYRKRDFDRALKDFDQAIKISPKDPAAFDERAQVSLDRGQYDRAIQDYSQAITLNPNDWRAYSGRGETLRRKGDLDAALASHNEAVKLNPKSADAVVNRALVWKEKGDLDQAISDYGEELLLNPNDDRALSNRGEIWRLKGDLARSLADLDKAVSLMGNSALTLCRRGDSFRERGDFDRSVADFDAAAQVSSTAICAYTGKGLALEKKGNPKDAKIEYDKALAIPIEKDPDPVSGKPAQIVARDHSAKLAEEARLEDERRTKAEKDQAASAAEKLLAEKATQQRLVKQAQDEALRRAAELDQARKAAEKLQLSSAPPKPLVIDQGKRVALVIGNSAYQNVQALTNPARDVDAMADAFRKVGFQTVQVEHDLTRDQLIKALRKFEDVAVTANWAVIYYAGHGMVLNGENYLVPVDARLLSDRDVADEAVSLNRVLIATEGAKKLRMVLLDACRDNPFLSKMRITVASRSLTRGLAAIEPGVGTLVVYAARDGQIALDGTGEHSPFAAGILNHIQTPNLEIGMFFRIVRDDVRSSTRRQQEPFVYGSLPGEDFYFSVK